MELVLPPTNKPKTQSPLKYDQKCKKNFDKVHLLSMDMKKHLKYDNVMHYATEKTSEKNNKASSSPSWSLQGKS